MELDRFTRVSETEWRNRLMQRLEQLNDNE